jgi:hypothetical protein
MTGATAIDPHPARYWLDLAEVYETTSIACGAPYPALDINPV